MRAMDADDAPPSPIALDLGPLIAPYRRHGRLSLRVERLPHRARLSRGHNNGDRSWSLMSDELEGLSYLPPREAAGACTLGIRIVSLDGGNGLTLALIDYPVAPDGAPAPAAAEKPRHALEGSTEGDNAELRRLREELAKSRADLAAAKKSWDGERQAQLAASSALASNALEYGRSGAEAALARAEREWKAAEAERLATAEAAWEARSAKAIADAAAQLDRTRSRDAAETGRARSDEAERRRLRDEVGRLKKSLAAREDELALAREHGQRESETLLAEAEGRWRAHEEQQLAAARTQWQERSERALAEAQSQFERVQARALSETRRRHQDAEVELEQLKDELALANEAIVDRENDIADIQSRLDSQIHESDRLRALGSENQQLRAETSKLQAGIAALQARLDEQIGEASSLRDAASDGLRLKDELDATRAQAEATLAEWKKAQAARLHAAEMQGAAQSQAQLAKMAKRLAQAEAELQQSRAQAQALLHRGDEDDIKALRQEFARLQSQLAERDRELAQARFDGEQARERWTTEARIALQNAEHVWRAEAEDAEYRKDRAQTTRRYLRDAALAASFSAFAVMGWLYYDTERDILSGVGSLAGFIGEPQAQASASLPMPLAAKAAPEHIVTILHAANVRSGPSKTASVIATLPRNADVASLERQGNWVRVKLGASSKTGEGWVYATYLMDKDKGGPGHL